MNFLKKKLKPLTSGLTAAGNQNQGGAGSGKQRDLEEDLYDEYVIEAPPHPSELLALGVDPNEIDVNDPDKLRALYKRAQEEGKDKKTNSVFLAKQRAKEELEEKKRTREEWKFFDSLTSRVEEAVKSSQRNLDHWKESSAVSELTEPDYDLKPREDLHPSLCRPKLPPAPPVEEKKLEPEVAQQPQEELDEFGCPREKTRTRKGEGEEEVASGGGERKNSFVVRELLEDFGIDLRSEEQKRALEKKRREEQEARLEEERKRRQLELAIVAAEARELQAKQQQVQVAPRPRPRPKSAQEDEQASSSQQEATQELDPFDTSFVAVEELEESVKPEAEAEELKPQAVVVDPFDTSYINLH